MLHFCLFLFGGNRSFLLEDSALLFEGQAWTVGHVGCSPSCLPFTTCSVETRIPGVPSTSLSPEHPAFRERSRGWAVAAGMLGQACLPELVEVVARGRQAHNVLVFYP